MKRFANEMRCCNNSVRFVTCGVLVDAYNKGLRIGSKNRLSLTWEAAEGDNNA